MDERTYEVTNDVIFAVENIFKELEHQEAKHGEHNATLQPFSSEMMCYIMEEVGESAQTLNDLKTAQRKESPQVQDLETFYINELTQVAALCVNEIARIVRNRPQLLQPE
jgi:hypothetical protein